MKKSTAIASAAILALPLALASCSGSTPSSGGDADTITVMDYYNNEPDKTMIGEAIDECAATIGITVKRTTVPGKDLIQKVLQQASSKTLPDVLMLDNPDVQQVAATGGLTPFGQLGLDGSGSAQGMIDAGTYEGELYGLAPTANTLGLFYNKKLLAEKGITPPATWDELKSAAAALTSGDQYGVAFSAIATYEGSWQFLPFMWTNGGDETDLTSPEVAEALQLWVDLVKSGSASDGVINWSQSDVKDQFLAGKAAMMINGPWQIPALDADASIEWGSVQVPVNKAGQTPVAPLGGELWTIPQTGDKAKQANAAQLVECLTSDDTEMKLATQRFTVPVRTSLAGDYVAEMPSMEAFVTQVENARSRTGELGEEWPKAATQIYTAIQLALTGQATAEDAFAQAAAG
ncbi:sugar ABC transporter substrate-binding protein [Microbacterium nymphoidis]|uniref:sugar ABC transporter substrate-binding protein n=1 Tax=Microbacterium nymphoidis TaxID=2898586 RepID=UPI001E2CEC01|nr:extracellular solute-binding protein [Microbacterium nymphoidis]MCD2497378.1 extracellular solute-binding protein [Microbacterium nymphoidis]